MFMNGILILLAIQTCTLHIPADLINPDLQCWSSKFLCCVILEVLTDILQKPTAYIFRAQDQISF